MDPVSGSRADQRPLLRVVKGDATPEEVATLVAVADLVVVSPDSEVKVLANNFDATLVESSTLDPECTGVTFHADAVGTFAACLEADPIDRLVARASPRVGQSTGGLLCGVDTCDGLRIAAYIGVRPRARRELDLLGARVSRVTRIVASA